MGCDRSRLPVGRQCASRQRIKFRRRRSGAGGYLRPHASSAIGNAVMNLALADIRHHFLRFYLASLAVGALFTACIGMIGLYRGVVFEALIVINDIGADLWVVEGQRNGPFAESSDISGLLDRRIEGVPGVSGVRRFIQFNQRYIVNGQRLQIAITGIDYPKDSGSW